MKKYALMLGLILIGVGALLAQEATPEAVITTRISAPDAANVAIVEVASGFSRPLYLTHAGDGSGRLFVLEQTGKIILIQEGERVDTPFLDLSTIVSQFTGYSERGLLGLAFHPEYVENGLFYVNYTDRNGDTVVSEYEVSADDPNVADPSSERRLLFLEQPYPNHNGGHLAFGPDGYLYISVGDGGAADDPLLTGQDPSDWYGSLLRINVNAEEGYIVPEDNPYVNNPEFSPEVWNYGLRNAWRFSFDRATGDLYLADVGQNMWEEVNFQPADSVGGENYGWNSFEASQPFATSSAPEGMIYPIAEYSHQNGDCSVTGGYVYRGEAITDLQGVYLFSDYCTGRVWATYRDESETWQTNEFLNLNRQVSSFGEDESGELYILDYDGVVLKLEPAQ